MPINPVTWFELNVSDIERAKAFYAAVFQVEFQDLSNPEMDYWCFPMDDQQVGAGGALMRMAGCEPGKGGTMVYFSCEDCAVEESRVRAGRRPGLPPEDGDRRIRLHLGGARHGGQSDRAPFHALIPACRVFSARWADPRPRDRSRRGCRPPAGGCGRGDA